MARFPFTASLALATLAAVATAANTTSVDDCSCGFYDASSDEVYTDAIIVYFNESSTLPENAFRTQKYVHMEELGWNTLYRQGARHDNVYWSANSTSADFLNISIYPYTPNHVVNGGGIEFVRQDIRYGSFRASMKGAPAGSGGSAMSMMLTYNDTSSIEIDLLNTDEPSTARISTLYSNEFPDTDLGVNYSILAAGSADYAPIDPWAFVPVKIDWTKDWMNWTIADNTSRTVDKSEGSPPTEPLPLYFKHWSNGDTYLMQGPPLYHTQAAVEWIRVFFNSSLTTTKEEKAFDARCTATDACLVDDESLRGATAYSAEALKKYEAPAASKAWRIPSAVLSGSSVFLGLLALVNAFLRRFDPKILIGKGTPKAAPKEPVLTSSSPSAMAMRSGMYRSPSNSSSSIGKGKDGYDSAFMSPQDTALNTPWDSRTPEMSRANSFADLKKNLAAQSDSPSAATGRQRPHSGAQSKKGNGVWSSASTITGTPRDGTASRPISSSTMASMSSDDFAKQSWAALGISGLPNDRKSIPIVVEEPCEDQVTANPFRDPSTDKLPQHNNEKLPEVTVTPVVSASTAPAVGPAPKTKRVDYLAGLTVIACLGVTQIHFMLSFVPCAGGDTDQWHYRSEIIARWWATPIFLDQIWLGPFFVTSCRFLVERFLRNGNLKDIAQKTLLRAPRMMIPIIIVAFLEYFFVELGLTAKLEYIPATSWSTWVYIGNYSSFGVFLNDVLELMYLIPNQAPEIINYYCVGVLWTVPVQLQFSFVTLLAAIMTRDIKSAWKRFGFYFFVLVNYWYALSWGSCFWLGLMLADLHVNYDWAVWVRARPLLHYTLLPLLIVVCLAGGPLFSLLEDRGIYNIMTNEFGIHPYVDTGVAISQSPIAGVYPYYYAPRLNIIIFAVSIQAVVELSTSFQWFLSLPVWTMLFPHTYTIYLFHGFVFWSIGAYTLVTTFATGLFPYWVCILFTFLVSYTCIGIGAVLLTPLAEGPSIAACKNIWRWAHDTVIPKTPTLMPFRSDLFLNRNGDAGPADEETTCKAANNNTVAAAEALEARDHFDATRPVMSGAQTPLSTRSSTIFSPAESVVDADETPRVHTPGPMPVPAPIQERVGHHPHRPAIASSGRSTSVVNLVQHRASN